MKERTVLYADHGTVLTNGTDYGKVIWLADNTDAAFYHAISQAEYDALVAAQEAAILNGGS